MTKTLFTFGLFALFAGLAIAQPGNPSSPTPFGFVEVLIGAGAAFGGYKVYKQKSKVTK